MSQEQQKEKRLFTYQEDVMNAVLAYLGEQKAKDVNTLINALLKPVDVRVEAKSVESEVVAQ